MLAQATIPKKEIQIQAMILLSDFENASDQIDLRGPISRNSSSSRSTKSENTIESSFWNANKSKETEAYKGLGD